MILHCYVLLNDNYIFQKVLNVNGAHSMFITGLEFLPVNGDGPPITSRSEAAVVSISVDNKVCIHSLPQRSNFIFQI